MSSKFQASLGALRRVSNRSNSPNTKRNYGVADESQKATFFGVRGVSAVAPSLLSTPARKGDADSSQALASKPFVIKRVTTAIPKTVEVRVRQASFAPRDTVSAVAVKPTAPTKQLTPVAASPKNVRRTSLGIQSIAHAFKRPQLSLIRRARVSVSHRPLMVWRLISLATADPCGLPGHPPRREMRS
jgi:hypothetical protein